MPLARRIIWNKQWRMEGQKEGEKKKERGHTDTRTHTRGRGQKREVGRGEDQLIGRRPTFFLLCRDRRG